MHKLSFLLKSYHKDLKYVERLLESYHKHNVDGIPIFVVVPETDLSLFITLKGNNIEVISDESVSTSFAKENEVLGFPAGYINQQIVKLSFWECGLTENYFCVDSDGVFIRDFFVSDFMFDDDTPYSILVEDKELMVDPRYYNSFWVAREKAIQRICHEINFAPERVLTSHGFSILSSKVLRSFKEKYLFPSNKNYLDILKISPYEFSWYNMWLQKDKTIPIEIIEPLVKCFHLESHHIEYIKRGVTVEDIARGYLGYVVNSNYSRDFGVVSYSSETNPYRLTPKALTNRVKSLVSKIIVRLLAKS